MDTVEFLRIAQEIEEEISLIMVGQQDLIRNTLICILAGGNLLLEGVPGLGKTRLVKTVSQVLSLKFSRIQFTPDLMPADITGTNIITEDQEGRKSFQFQPGPVFSNIILADEINRATPKTQSALLEAMQEKSVSSGGQTRELEKPFFVMATQNPLEMEGTYPLPEAQTDRFLFKLLVDFPSEEDLSRIINMDSSSDSQELRKIVSADEILEMSQIARQVPVGQTVNNFVVRTILASHPDSSYAPQRVKKYVRFGASPRGGQALIASSKVRALMEGRFNAAVEDIEKLACPALRHRIILNFEGQAEGVNVDDIISDILAAVKNDLP